LILLDLQLINFWRACMISWEAPSQFPHSFQPWLYHTWDCPKITSHYFNNFFFITICYSAPNPLWM